jgi:hypothetical protein
MIQHKMVFHLGAFHKEIHRQTTNQLPVRKHQLYFEILRFPD